MLTHVLQDVDEGVSHFARGPECPGMISVAPETSVPAENPVDSLREPDGESLEATGERFSTVRLDDHVEVIGLDGKLENTESPPGTLREAAAQDREDSISPQRRQRAVRAERNVHGVAGDMGRPRAMGNTDLPAGRLTPRAGTAATPGAWLELQLNRSCHLD